MVGYVDGLVDAWVDECIYRWRMGGLWVHGGFMDGRVYGQIDGWVEGWVDSGGDELSDRLMVGWTDAQTYGWMLIGRMDLWMMGRQMSGWIDGQGCSDTKWFIGYIDQSLDRQIFLFPLLLSLPLLKMRSFDHFFVGPLPDLVALTD